MERVRDALVAAGSISSDEAIRVFLPMPSYDPEGAPRPSLEILKAAGSGSALLADQLVTQRLYSPQHAATLPDPEPLALFYEVLKGISPEEASSAHSVMVHFSPEIIARWDGDALLSRGSSQESLPASPRTQSSTVNVFMPASRPMTVGGFIRAAFEMLSVQTCDPTQEERLRDFMPGQKFLVAEVDGGTHRISTVHWDLHATMPVPLVQYVAIMDSDGPDKPFFLPAFYFQFDPGMAHGHPCLVWFGPEETWHQVAERVADESQALVAARQSRGLPPSTPLVTRAHLIVNGKLREIPLTTTTTTIGEREPALATSPPVLAQQIPSSGAFGSPISLAGLQIGLEAEPLSRLAASLSATSLRKSISSQQAHGSIRIGRSKAHPVPTTAQQQPPSAQ